ncbi:HEAT repeat domain-containing protein [Streptomyces sp. NBC_01565]|uniref:HEAT repeat domain-containing protein n=1 Tax=unclassified Streptomyces TaxID=2593676 RepID=UPI00224D3509|nr:HEAT repeat domain-containing protein [Streptomyces sp. NBC_01565]MCX4545713.1 hypothetical protein [Streptomyces sp. NBC_01565]
MRPETPVHGPADCTETYIDEVRRDPAGARCGAALSAIFHAVRKDRAGPVTVRLLDRISDAPADVRLLLLQLLTSLCTNATAPWPEAAAAAVALMRDPDEPVRRAAAWLLAEADHPQAVGLLTDPGQAPDPVARLALAEALLVRPAGPERQALRADHDPAIRLRATLRPGSDAILADLDAAGARLGGPGGRVSWSAGTVWGLAAVRSGDENACYEDIGLLASRDTPMARRAAIDMSRTALAEWRAAPEALVPHLRPLLGAGADPGVRAAAAAVVAGPLASARLCAGELAGLLDELPEVAAPALARLGDVRAVPRLCGLVAGGRPAKVVVEAVQGLARAGADLDPLVAAAADFLDRHEGSKDRGVWAAVVVLCGCGAASAAAVPQLLRLLDADDGAVLRTQAVLALGETGPGAAAAVPLLEGLTEDAGTRLAGHAEMSLIRITGDRRRAERVFARLHEWRRNLSLAADLLEWLAGHGGLEPRHVAYLREACADPERRPVHPKYAGTLWRHEGHAAAELALNVLPRYLDSDLHGPYVCGVLGDMGAAAAGAVPALRAMVERRTRVPTYTGDRDEETRADERLTAAARTALRRIADAPAAGGALFPAPPWSVRKPPPAPPALPGCP